MKRSILIAHYRADIVSGAEKAVAEMVQAADSDYQFIMLVPGEGKLAEYYRQLELPLWVRPISTPRRLYPGLHEFQSYQFSRVLRSKNVHAAVANTFPAASRIGSACRYAGVPYAIYVREYIRNIPSYSRVLNKADAIFAVSKSVAKHVEGLNIRRPLLVLYDNLLEDRLTSAAASEKRGEPLPFEMGVPLVGWIGRITPYKQPDLFLRSIPHVLKNMPEARFLVIGSAKAEEQAYEISLKQLVMELGISEQVVFLGQRSDIPSIMKELSAVCITSRREPFSRVILEAQALHCPVIAPNRGGSPEAVVDNVTGLLFDSLAPDAEQQLARQIFTILSQPDKAAAMRSSAAEWLHKGFGSRQPVIEFEKALDALIKGQYD